MCWSFSANCVGCFQPIVLVVLSQLLMLCVGRFQPVVDAVFSPDGSALATASLDGYVKFFEVNWQNSDSSPAYVFFVTFLLLT
jgi:WD40 repeat protein